MPITEVCGASARSDSSPKGTEISGCRSPIDLAASMVKNLTHIPFGLMERRRRERRNEMIATALERMTDKEFPADIRDEFPEGGAEIDLVRSGLEDVMRSTWARIADLMGDQPELADYRTAAYFASIRQIADAYEAIGI